MLPPKIEPSKDSTGHTPIAATASRHCDASQPMNCSKTNSTLDQERLNVGFNQGIFKHFHRPSRVSVLNPTSVARIVRSRMSLRQEELWVLALSPTKKLAGFEMLFRGTTDACLVHPRDIIRFLCECNATSFIVAHNHPSGEVQPSEHDWLFTRRLIECGHLIEIPLIDHVIVTAKAHTSMASSDADLFSQKRRNYRALPELYPPGLREELDPPPRISST